MKKLKRLMVVLEALGIVTLCLMGLAMMALTDIYHGDTQVRLEWWIVRILFLFFAVFIVAAFVAVKQVRRFIADREEKT